MGLAMASNLQRHVTAKKATSLIYSNRTMLRGSPLRALGGIPEPNFEKLVSQCGIIFTMVGRFYREYTHINATKTPPRSPMTQCSKVFYPLRWVQASP